MQTNKQKNSEVRNYFFKLLTAEDCLANIPPILKEVSKESDTSKQILTDVFLRTESPPKL